MTEAIETFTSGSALRVDVTAIERELAALWKAAAVPREGTAAPVTRASLLTLVVWESRPQGARLPPETIARIVETHPCRILVAEIDPGTATESIEAWISAHCHRTSPGARQVCCEQVTLRASAASARQIPGLAAALSLPGLPAYLYAPGEPPFGDAAFRRLAGNSSRLIVDSAGYDVRGALAGLAALAALRSTALGDLNWHRLHPWQNLIASFFDPPVLRPQIPFIAAVECSGGAGSEATARLLAGWLRAALAGRPINFTWSLDRQVPEGTLQAVTLRAPGGPTPATLVVEGDRSAGMMTGRLEVEGTCPIPRRLRPQAWDVARLLGAELERSGRDPLFETSLAHAASFRSPSGPSVA